MKYNKKRNSMFLYEVLTKELAICLKENNQERAQVVTQIIKESFNKNKHLYRDFRVYKQIMDTHNETPYVAQSIIQEAKEIKRNLDENKLYREQTILIDKIHKRLGNDIFENFIPSYRILGLTHHVLSKSEDIKDKAINESRLIKIMTSPDVKSKAKILPLDKLTYKIFAEKFNSKYGSSLNEDQKKLIKYYIFSVSDNELSFKYYLNEELSRLEKIVESSLKLNEVSSDEHMVSKTKEVLRTIESFKSKKIDDNLIKGVMKLQALAEEITKDGN